MKKKRKYVKRGTALIRDLRAAERAIGRPLIERVAYLERENMLLRAALLIEKSKVANMLKVSKRVPSRREMVSALSRKAA